MRLIRFLTLFVIMSGEVGCAIVRQPPLSPPGISVEEKVNLGGWDQTVFIRGRNRANPILLFVHGGPGLPEMPFSHVNADLERDFTMVNWDQRGAGKSYSPEIPVATMNVNQAVRDTEQLTRYLRSTFGQKQIYLVGFSYGTLISALAVSRHPEYYRAYVGISQLTALERSERLLYYAGIARADRVGRDDVARQLRLVGPPPYARRHDERLANHLKKQSLPSLPLAMTPWRYLRLALESPYYSIWDDINVLRGIHFSGLYLEAGIYEHDLFSEVPEMKVPATFLLGRYDTVLSQPLTEQYFRDLRAPRGKRLVWFEHSDHILHLEESARFRAELREVLQQTR